MNTQHDDNPLSELGVFSVVAPAVWLVAGMAGFTLLAQRPEWFADPARMEARPAINLDQEPAAAPAGMVPAGQSKDAAQLAAIP